MGDEPSGFSVIDLAKAGAGSADTPVASSDRVKF
jgi:hypothetical protein